MSNEKIAQLKQDYPVWEVKNKTNVAKPILLADGESVIVPAKGKAKIHASNINNFPDFKEFEFVTPDLKTLVSYDIITKNEPVAPPAPPAPPAEPPVAPVASPSTSSAPSSSSSATDTKSSKTAAKE